eukprot:s719_g19.t1
MVHLCASVLALQFNLEATTPVLRASFSFQMHVLVLGEICWHESCLSRGHLADPHPAAPALPFSFKTTSHTKSVLIGKHVDNVSPQDCRADLLKPSVGTIA